MMIFKEGVEKKIPLKLRYLRSVILKKMGFGGVFFTFPTTVAIRSAITNDIVGIVGAKNLRLKVRSSHNKLDKSTT